MDTSIPFIVAALSVASAVAAFSLCRRYVGVTPSGGQTKESSLNTVRQAFSTRLLSFADDISNIAPLKTKRYSRLSKELLHAGLGTISPGSWHGFEILSTLSFAVASALAGLMSNGPLVAFLAIGLIIGIVLPQLVLKYLVRQRRKRIEAEVANILEELSIAVKSGYSIERGIRLIGSEMSGTLAEEFKRADIDINAVGMDFSRAMKSMAMRCDCPAVDSFCAALIQARTQGTSISRVLESQAKLARQERATQQMEEVNKLPGKLVAPIFGIMMLIIVLCLAPPIYNMIGVFGSAWNANGAGTVESLSTTNS